MRDLGLTLAGGGNRSFYQQGLLEEWGEALWPRVGALATCSAGSAIAVLLLSERAAQARAYWDALRRGITKNVDLGRAWKREPIAPHGHIYRSTIVHAMERGGLERLRAQPFPIYVLCAAPPKRLGIEIATWLGLGTYALERRLRPQALHPHAGMLLGFKEHVIDVRDCTTPEQVADLVLASSATPPFTPVGNFRGTALLDGGLVDNAPAFVADRTPGVKRNLVLLTRPYARGVAGVRGTRLYIAPSEMVPVDRWDYTESAPVEETVALGRRDAKLFASALDAWMANLEHPASAQARTSARPSVVRERGKA
jgi:predicted acylesterase/phospholipase RssA